MKKVAFLWDQKQVFTDPADVIRDFRQRESSMVRVIHLLQLDWPESGIATIRIAGYVTSGLVRSTDKVPVIHGVLKESLRQYYDNLRSSDHDRLRIYLCSMYSGLAEALSSVTLMDGAGEKWDPASGASLTEWAAARKGIEVKKSKGNVEAIYAAMAANTLTDSLQKVLGGVERGAVCG